MTSLSRTDIDLLAVDVCNEEKLMFVNQYAEDNNLPPVETFTQYLFTIAKMGGYLGRKSDLPPGNEVVAKGISKLNEMLKGFKLLAKKLVGINDNNLFSEYKKKLMNTLLLNSS